jgi:hypothetical protein
MHPDLAPIAFLCGTWAGEGTGEYPTIEPFAYGEEVRFTHTGKPFLVYTQRTWALDDGRPLHAECGYWRPQPGGRLEVVLAHPTGIVEVEEGAVTGRRIELASTVVGRTTTAKEVRALRRVFEVDGDTLTYRVSMAAVGVPMTHHLAATLVRQT